MGLRMWMGLAVVIGLAASASAKAPELVSASWMGTGGDDLLEDVAIDVSTDPPTILVAGMLAQPVEMLAGAKAVTLGKPHGPSPYGSGLVARLSHDGRKVLAATQLAAGVGQITTVVVGGGGVYVGGYATAGLEQLLPAGGLLSKCPADAPPGPFTPREHTERSNPQPDKSKVGVPFVLRLSADLSRVEAGTYLEGRHTIWHVPRPLDESKWQPTGIGILADGSVVVAHDGGPIVPPPAGQKPGAFNFYRCPDHLSRLSGDLKQRMWKIDMYAVPVDPDRAAVALKEPWTFDSLGNTRTLRLRTGPGDAVYLAGWAASRTTKEPWWAPFLRRFDADGKMVWEAYTFDPTSGRDARLNGLVSDAAIRSVAVDAEGQVLVATIGDGGNSVLRQDPRDYTRPVEGLRGNVHTFRGRTLFWGTVARLDAKSRAFLGGDQIAGFNDRGLVAAWAEDVAAVCGKDGGGRTVAVGRHGAGFRFTPDAWRKSDAGAFVRMYERDYRLAFSTGLPDAELVTVAAGPDGRCAAVGVARSDKCIVKDSASAKHAGRRDGYVVVFDP